MSLGLIARKCGMTRIYNQETGASVPVTVLAVDANRIAQFKTEQTDGYIAIQVAAGSTKASRVTKPQAGHFAKAEIQPASKLYEFRVSEEVQASYKLGQELTAELFSDGQSIDIKGTSKGKGFSGTIKRHNFSSQDATHGNSLAHRVPGSTGMNQSPGRVFPGKKMPGQLGNVKATIQNQVIIKVDKERNLILVKGGVPGAPGSHVVLLPSVKAKNGGQK